MYCAYSDERRTSMTPFALILTLTLAGVDTEIEVVPGVINEATCEAAGAEFVADAVVGEARTFVCVASKNK